MHRQLRLALAGEKNLVALLPETHAKLLATAKLAAPSVVAAAA